MLSVSIPKKRKYRTFNKTLENDQNYKTKAFKKFVDDLPAEFRNHPEEDILSLFKFFFSNRKESEMLQSPDKKPQKIIQPEPIPNTESASYNANLTPNIKERNEEIKETTEDSKHSYSSNSKNSPIEINSKDSSLAEGNIKEEQFTPQKTITNISLTRPANFMKLTPNPSPQKEQRFENSPSHFRSPGRFGTEAQRNYFPNPQFPSPSAHQNHRNEQFPKNSQSYFSNPHQNTNNTPESINHQHSKPNHYFCNLKKDSHGRRANINSRINGSNEKSNSAYSSPYRINQNRTPESHPFQKCIHEASPQSNKFTSPDKHPHKRTNLKPNLGYYPQRQTHPEPEEIKFQKTYYSPESSNPYESRFINSQGNKEHCFVKHDNSLEEGQIHQSRRNNLHQNNRSNVLLQQQVNALIRSQNESNAQKQLLKDSLSDIKQTLANVLVRQRNYEQAQCIAIENLKQLAAKQENLEQTTQNLLQLFSQQQSPSFYHSKSPKSENPGFHSNFYEIKKDRRNEDGRGITDRNQDDRTRNERNHTFMGVKIGKSSDHTNKKFKLPSTGRGRGKFDKSKTNSENREFENHREPDEHLMRGNTRTERIEEEAFNDRKGKAGRTRSNEREESCFQNNNRDFSDDVCDYHTRSYHNQDHQNHNTHFHRADSCNKSKNMSCDNEQRASSADVFNLQNKGAQYSNSHFSSHENIEYNNPNKHAAKSTSASANQQMSNSPPLPDNYDSNPYNFIK